MKAAYRRFLIPGLSTLLMLIILLGLGTWQVYRLQWKEGILAQIAAAEAAPPVPLLADPRPYTKVLVTGHFRFDRAAQFGAEVRDMPAGPIMGFYQIVPLERDNAPPILVNRGWLPQKRKATLDDPEGVVGVTGYVRPPDVQHWFSSPDDAAARDFYTLDPKTIGNAIGVPGLVPFTLMALGPPEAFPVAAQYLPRPPNNHLAYAITWYGLAAALAVIFSVWCRKALRS